MSHILNTSVAPFCHSQDHPGSVPVTACDYAAGFAPEGSFSESEWLLGSRETLGTRHGCIGGLDQHHLPASPLGTVDQSRLAAPIAASAAFLAIVDLERNFGLKSSTAIRS